MKAHDTKLMSLSLLACATGLSSGALVSWGAVGTNIQAGDILESGSPFLAVNGGTDTAILTVGSNTFYPSPFTGAVSGSVSNTGNGGFYSPSSGDVNLDAVLDSHTYISGANPSGQGTVTIEGLTVGNTYEAQFIGVGDDRGCCAGRVQFVDDGNGNVSGGLTRGTGDWVVGTFVADAASQNFYVTGETDPGLSGLVIRDLGVTAVPEPSAAVLSLAGLLGLMVRRRR